MEPRVPTQAAKSAAKRTLRIVSKCSTQAEFVAVFRRLCDRQSIFIATSNPKPAGTAVRFNVTLADGTSMLAGEGDVAESFPSSENRWGRPGMRIEFDSLAPHSYRMLELFASESSAQLRDKATQPKTEGLPPPVRGSAPSPLPLKPTFSVPKVIPPVKKQPALPPEPIGDDLDGEEEDADTQLSDAADGFVLACEEANTILTPAVTTVETGSASGEQRVKGSDYILPANPFGELAAESLEAFVECTLYEETGAIPLPEAEQGSEREAPPWWPGSGHTPRPELIPQNIAPDDEPNDELKALVEASTDAAIPMPIPAPPVLPPVLPAPAVVAEPAPPAVPVPATMSVGTDAGSDEAIPAAIPAPSWYGSPASPDEAPGNAASAEVNFDSRPATPIPVGPLPIPNAVPVSPAAAPILPMSAPAPIAAASAQPWGPMPTAARTRKPMIIAAGVVAVLAVIAIAMMGGGDEKSSGDGTAAAAPTAKTEKSPEPEPAAKEPSTPDAPAPRAKDTPPADEPPTVDPAGDPTAEPAAGSDGANGEEGEEESEPPAPEPAATPEPQTAATPPPIADGECRIKIDARPSEVSVFLGKRELGTAPGELAIPCGKHTLSFKRSRYQPKTAAVEASPGSVSSVQVALTRPVHVLKIASLPSKAEVYVGGRKLGVTPLQAKLPGFEGVSLKIVKAGYKTWTSKLYLKKPSQSVRVRLKRNR